MLFLQLVLRITIWSTLLLTSAGSDDLGDVAIVLTRGRSGSDYVSRLAENICGSAPRSFAGHPFGVHVKEMEAIQNPREHMKKSLQERRRKYPKNCIGFKWKIFVDNEDYDDALKWAAKMKFALIYSHRNPLDEYISRLKHDAMDLKSHCFILKDGFDCLERTRHVKVVVPLQPMLEFVTNRTSDVVKWRNKLDSMKARFLEVNYEDLTFGSEQRRLRHLQRMADFILPNVWTDKTITMKYYETDGAVTSSYNQSDTVDNFHEMAAFLRATQFSDLLHG